MTDPRKPAESQLHDFTAKLLRFNAAPGVIWWHTPNGEDRHPAVAAKLKSMGVLAGVSDIEILIPGKGAAFLELKTESGVLSRPQAYFLDGAQKCGCLVAVARTPEQVMTILLDWGAIKRMASLEPRRRAVNG